MTAWATLRSAAWCAGQPFAGGGMVGGMSNVTIQFPGLPPISGLRASSAVVDELRRVGGVGASTLRWPQAERYS